MGAISRDELVEFLMVSCHFCARIAKMAPESPMIHRHYNVFCMMIYVVTKRCFPNVFVPFDGCGRAKGAGMVPARQKSFDGNSTARAPRQKSFDGDSKANRQRLDGAGC